MIDVQSSTIRMELPEVPAFVGDTVLQRELALIYNALHILHMAVEPSAVAAVAAMTVLDTVTIDLTMEGGGLSANVNLPAVNYLTDAEATDLTDSGNSNLHTHDADRIYAQIASSLRI